MKCPITKNKKPICNIVDELKYWKKECKSFQRQLDELHKMFDIALRELSKLREELKGENRK